MNLPRDLSLGLWSTERLGDHALRWLMKHGLGQDPSSADVHPATRRSLERFFEGFDRASHDRLRVAGDRVLGAHDARGARLVLWGDEEYPSQLAASPSPPAVLAVRGAVDALRRDLVAVVGTRGVSATGRTLCRKTVDRISERGMGVVSGGAFGIDAEAHAQALRRGATTVIVCGTGLDRVYPAAHERLFARVARHGAVVSQYPLGADGRGARFPRRNATIAGLALAAIIVEAPQGSGALHTAHAAKRMKRPVFVVPGPGFAPSFAGGHALVPIGDARLLYDEGVLDGILAGSRAAPRKPRGLLEGRVVPTCSARSPTEGAILKLLRESNQTRDTLMSSVAGSADASLALLQLELRGAVVRLPGERFALAGRMA